MHNLNLYIYLTCFFFFSSSSFSTLWGIIWAILLASHGNVKIVIYNFAVEIYLYLGRKKTCSVLFFMKYVYLQC